MRLSISEDVESVGESFESLMESNIEEKYSGPGMGEKKIACRHR